MQKITIAEPCHQNWDAMTPTEQGRHCQSCVKTVHDVSNLSDEEVFDQYKKLGGNMCIRIPAHRAIVAPRPWYAKWKYGIAATLMSFWLSAQNLVAEAQNIDGDSVDGDKDEVTFDKITIRGKIIDSLVNDDPIAYAIVYIYKDSNQVAAGISREDGTFAIDIEQTLKNTDSLTIKISHVAYKEITQKMKDLKRTMDIEVLIGQDHICTSAVNITVESKYYIQGGMRMGIMITQNGREIYKLKKETYDTKTFYSDEIERHNLGR